MLRLLSITVTESETELAITSVTLAFFHHLFFFFFLMHRYLLRICCSVTTLFSHFSGEQ